MGVNRLISSFSGGRNHIYVKICHGLPAIWNMLDLSCD